MWSRKVGATFKIVLKSFGLNKGRKKTSSAKNADDNYSSHQHRLTTSFTLTPDIHLSKSCSRRRETLVQNYSLRPTELVEFLIHVPADTSNGFLTQIILPTDWSLNHFLMHLLEWYERISNKTINRI